METRDASYIFLKQSYSTVNHLALISVILSKLSVLRYFQ